MKCQLKHRTRVSKKKGTSNNHPSSHGHTWEKLMKEYVYENALGEPQSHTLHIGRKCKVCVKVVLNAKGDYLE